MALIELRAVERSYKTTAEEVRALRDVDLQIERGEFVAVMGPSGSGKSTLMNILGCLDRPTSGSYLLNGTTVEDLGDEELSAIRNREIGFVFQTFCLLDRMNAVGNVELPLIYADLAPRQRRRIALEALEKVGLGDRVDHQPRELSGGQQQRVAIARALVNRPSILLADEPTGNLDSATSLEIMDLIDAIHREGNTIVLVTHETDVAKHAERCLRLLDGKVIDDVDAKLLVGS